MNAFELKLLQNELKEEGLHRIYTIADDSNSFLAIILSNYKGVLYAKDVWYVDSLSALEKPRVISSVRSAMRAIRRDVDELQGGSETIYKKKEEKYIQEFTRFIEIQLDMFYQMKHKERIETDIVKNNQQIILKALLEEGRSIGEIMQFFMSLYELNPVQEIKDKQNG